MSTSIRNISLKIWTIRLFYILFSFYHDIFIIILLSSAFLLSYNIQLLRMRKSIEICTCTTQTHTHIICVWYYSQMRWIYAMWRRFLSDDTHKTDDHINAVSVGVLLFSLVFFLFICEEVGTNKNNGGRSKGVIKLQTTLTVDYYFSRHDRVTGHGDSVRWWLSAHVSSCKLKGSASSRYGDDVYPRLSESSVAFSDGVARRSTYEICQSIRLTQKVFTTRMSALRGGG